MRSRPSWTPRVSRPTPASGRPKATRRRSTASSRPSRRIQSPRWSRRSPTASTRSCRRRSTRKVSTFGRRTRPATTENRCASRHSSCKEVCPPSPAAAERSRSTGGGGLSAKSNDARRRRPIVRGLGPPTNTAGRMNQGPRWSVRFCPNSLREQGVLLKADRIDEGELRRPDAGVVRTQCLRRRRRIRVEVHPRLICVL